MTKSIKDIKLRPFNDSDLSLFKEWLQKPYVAKYYHDPEDWVDEMEKRNTEFNWIIHRIAEVDGKPIGFCQYYLYELSIPYGENWHGTVPLEGTYSLDYMIGEETYLRHGYGRWMTLQMVDMIKQNEDAKRIIVQPEEGNQPSCNTLLSSGFQYDEENKLFILEF